MPLTEVKRAVLNDDDIADHLKEELPSLLAIDATSDNGFTTSVNLVTNLPVAANAFEGQTVTVRNFVSSYLGGGGQFKFTTTPTVQRVNIVAGGTNYSVGDILTVDAATGVKVRVTDVDLNTGAVLSVVMVSTEEVALSVLNTVSHATTVTSRGGVGATVVVDTVNADGSIATIDLQAGGSKFNLGDVVGVNGGQTYDDNGAVLQVTGAALVAGKLASGNLSITDGGLKYIPSYATISNPSAGGVITDVRISIDKVDGKGRILEASIPKIVGITKYGGTGFTGGETFDIEYVDKIGAAVTTKATATVVGAPGGVINTIKITSKGENYVLTPGPAELITEQFTSYSDSRIIPVDGSGCTLQVMAHDGGYQIDPAQTVEVGTYTDSSNNWWLFTGTTAGVWQRIGDQNVVTASNYCIPDDGTDTAPKFYQMLQAFGDGQTLDLEYKTYMLHNDVTPVPSSTAVDGADYTSHITARDIDECFHLDGRHNITIKNGTLDTPNHIVSTGSSYYFPSNLAITECSGVTLDNIKSFSKGILYGNAGTASLVGTAGNDRFLQRRKQVVAGAGSGLFLASSDKVLIKDCSFLYAGGSDGAAYLSSCTDVTLDNSYASAEMQGSAAFAIDSWAGNPALTGYSKNTYVFDNCSSYRLRDNKALSIETNYDYRRQDNRDSYGASKGCIVSEAEDVEVTVNGGVWRDAIYSTELNGIFLGAAFRNTGGTFYINDATVSNCTHVTAVSSYGDVNIGWFAPKMIVNGGTFTNIGNNMHTYTGNTKGTTYVTYSGVTGSMAEGLNTQAYPTLANTDGIEPRQPNKLYKIFDWVLGDDPVTPGDPLSPPNARAYRAVSFTGDGGTALSGTSSPDPIASWPTSINGSVSDGEITWQARQYTTEYTKTSIVAFTNTSEAYDFIEFNDCNFTGADVFAESYRTQYGRLKITGGNYELNDKFGVINGLGAPDAGRDYGIHICGGAHLEFGDLTTNTLLEYNMNDDFNPTFAMYMQIYVSSDTTVKSSTWRQWSDVNPTVGLSALIEINKDLAQLDNCYRLEASEPTSISNSVQLHPATSEDLFSDVDGIVELSVAYTKHTPIPLNSVITIIPPNDVVGGDVTMTPYLPSVWSSGTYDTGDLVIPTTRNGYVYIALKAGVLQASGVATGGGEPTWSTTLGGITLDGEISWITLLDSSWAPDTAQSIGNIRYPTTFNGYAYMVSEVTGDVKTHATTEPVWPTALGETIVDDAVTWRCIANPYKDVIHLRVLAYGGTANPTNPIFSDKLYQDLQVVTPNAFIGDNSFASSLIKLAGAEPTSTYPVISGG